MCVVRAQGVVFAVLFVATVASSSSLATTPAGLVVARRRTLRRHHNELSSFTFCTNFLFFIVAVWLINVYVGPK